ncbi:MAG: chitobiase/beta-hexosaminidase C-terminal domain-containing protein [Clostridiales Family XIII bacterium]|jgi:tetratricopeptide (TPR) repeat protein|nr:chitobiase/beta-hexosaminidase C-terminal domain-containing protein [Clostridiales Family XIII bacterium]
MASEQNRKERITKPGDSADQKPSVARPDADERSRKKKRVRITVVAVMGAILLIAAAACVYYYGFVYPTGNYDAQMKIGAEHYEAGEYEEAEAAFLRALDYRPGDPDATFALADTYTGWEKYDKAVVLLTALQETDTADMQTYERLLTLYVNHLNDIDAANEQILKAYDLGLALTHEAIAAAPVFSPQGGVYNEPTVVTITAGEGQAIYYTTDGTMPTLKSEKYEAELTLKNQESMIVTAVVIAENGLIGWPTKAEYAIDIQYAIDSTVLDYIGKSAAEIMGSVGALFYEREGDVGYYYRNKTGDSFFIFPQNVFPAMEVPAAPSGAAVTMPPDPNRTPLPSNAVCVAVSTKISRLFLQIEDVMLVEDLMAGLKIPNYNVETSAADGQSHLYYSANGYAFNYTLKDSKTVSGDGDVFIRAG